VWRLFAIDHPSGRVVFFFFLHQLAKKIKETELRFRVIIGPGSGSHFEG
jgi:hypothetical protein